MPDAATEHVAHIGNMHERANTPAACQPAENLEPSPRKNVVKPPIFKLNACFLHRCCRRAIRNPKPMRERARRLWLSTCSTNCRRTRKTDSDLEPPCTCPVQRDSRMHEGGNERFDCTSKASPFVVHSLHRIKLQHPSKRPEQKVAYPLPNKRCKPTAR